MPRLPSCSLRAIVPRVLLLFVPAVAATSPLWLVAYLWITSGAQTAAGEPPELTKLAGDFQQHTQPLIKKYCLECHAADKREGELDLERFVDLASLRHDPAAWLKVVEMLDNGEMPPKDHPQPTADQRRQIRDWARGYLDAEAAANAGDPGPVVLRRLSNVEYNYTVRDLTGIDLQPAREFPVDGAAGEGFVNVGDALSISPALLEKYFAAAQGIASHMVLLPDGFRFSAKSTRPDWTDEIASEIKQLYAQYCGPETNRKIKLQGLEWNSNAGGLIPLEAYFKATIEHRAELSSPDAAQHAAAITQIAKQDKLSPKYLGILWTLLTGNEPLPLIEHVRVRWRAARPEDVPVLSEEIRQWQAALTRIHRIGHFERWQDPIDPLTASKQFKIKLTPDAKAKQVVLYLVSHDAGDGGEHDLLNWQQARLELAGRPTLLLRDLQGGLAALVQKRQSLSEAAKYLAAIDAVRSSPTVDVGALAAERGLDAAMLAAWLKYLGFAASSPTKIDMLLTERAEGFGGYAFLKYWGSSETPFVVANSSDQRIRAPGIFPPHSISLHPSPTQRVVAAWRSPISGSIKVTAGVTHTHPECGNATNYILDFRRGNERRRLAQAS